jgi:hypothetical protein
MFVLPEKLLFSGDFQACFGALQSVFGAGVIGLGIVALQALLGTLSRFLRARDIDFLRTFGSLSQDGDLVRKNLHKPPSHRESMGLATHAIADYSDGQFRDERRVTGKNAQIPVQARNLRFFRGALYYQLLGSNDFELESVGHSSQFSVST